MNILFRVDAGGNVGLGHFFRTIHLAKTLQLRRHSVFFIHRNSQFWESFKKQHKDLETFGYELESIDFATIRIIETHNIEIFYVDGILEFTKDFIIAISEKVKIIFYQNISKSRSLADIYILPSLHQGQSFFQDFESDTLVYQGLEYLLFHSDIYNLDPKKGVNETVKTIGIITGGSDPQNTLLSIFNLIHHEDYVKTKFIYFFGSDFLHTKSLPELHKSNIRFSRFKHSRVLKCDLLLSSFGVSTYEFMCLGLPIMSYGHKESNAKALLYLAESTGGLIDLGLVDSLTPTYLNNRLLKIINNHKLRTEIVSNAQKAVSKRGLENIVEIIESNSNGKFQG